MFWFNLKSTNQIFQQKNLFKKVLLNHLILINCIQKCSNKYNKIGYLCVKFWLHPIQFETFILFYFQNYLCCCISSLNSHLYFLWQKRRNLKYISMDIACSINNVKITYWETVQLLLFYSCSSSMRRFVNFISNANCDKGN